MALECSAVVIRIMAYSQQGTAVCAGLGLVMWAVFGVALLTTDPGGGANIGAGMVALVAFALSILAASSLVTSAKTSTAKSVGLACIMCWVLWLGIAVTGADPDALYFIAGLIAFALLVWCFVIALRLPDGRRE